MSALLALAVAGHKPSVAELLAGVRPAIVRYCHARVPAGHAEDVAQNACLAVLAALPGFEDRGVPFEAFAFTLARYAVAEFRRREARRPVVPFADVPDTADTTNTPEQVAERHELSRALLAALDLLTDQQRAVLLLRSVGVPAGEVADALRSTPGAVRAVQYRAIRCLRRTGVPLPV